MLDIQAMAVNAQNALFDDGRGVVVSVWDDGSVTAHESDDPRRNAYGIPLLTVQRAQWDVPTLDSLTRRLRAAASLRGLELSVVTSTPVPPSVRLGRPIISKPPGLFYGQSTHPR